MVDFIYTVKSWNTKQQKLQNETLMPIVGLANYHDRKVSKRISFCTIHVVGSSMDKNNMNNEYGMYKHYLIFK